MKYFSLCKIARMNHRVVEQAPGNGRFSRRPLPDADGFVVTTKRCGFESGSNGQDEHAGLAYSMKRWISFTSAAPRTLSQLFGPHQEQHETPAGTEQSGA